MRAGTGMESGNAAAGTASIPDPLADLPGDENTRRLDARFVWHPFMACEDPLKRPAMVVSQAAGHFVEDDRGRAYLDAMAGLWCVNVGYGRRTIAEAAYRQLKRMAYYPHTWANEPAAQLAARLSDLLGGGAGIEAGGARGDWRTYFVQSGSEANEAAFKIARQYHLQRHPGQRRYKIVSRQLAYHGTTLATLAAGGMAPRNERFEPLPGGFVHVPAPYCYRCPFGLTYPRCGVACAQAVEQAVVAEGPETVAAVVIEPIQSGAGVLDPPDEYLPMVAEACRRHGVLLVVDEVINGFGRTGRMFGHQWFGVEPDIVTMAKGLSSGYMPIGAMTATSQVFTAFLGTTGTHREAAQISTFGGHAAAAAAALENIDIIEREGLAERALEVGKHLARSLRMLGYDVVGDVRGRGLLLAVELVADRASRRPLPEGEVETVVRDCLDAGVIVGRTAYTAVGGGNTITIAPPLTWSRDEADHLVETLDWALSRLRKP